MGAYKFGISSKYFSNQKVIIKIAKHTEQNTSLNHPYDFTDYSHHIQYAHFRANTCRSVLALLRISLKNKNYNSLVDLLLIILSVN